MRKVHPRLWVSLALLLAVSGAASGASWTLVIENLSNNVLSPAVFITHNSDFDLFTVYEVASPAIELIAESGDFSGVVAEAAAAQAQGDVLDWAVAGAAPIQPGATETITIEADEQHPLISFASMLGWSNDGFIGAATGDGAFPLFQNGQPVNFQFTVSFLNVYDAGTEINTEAAADIGALGAGANDGPNQNGVITFPHPGIQGIGDIPKDRDWYGGDVARITIVPEPGSLIALAVGVSGLLAVRRRTL